VSPSWRDRIEVFLAPQAVDLAQFRRALRPQAGLAHRQACDPIANSADWRPSIAALDRALNALAWRSADAHVALSNHFVRLALVPSVEAAADERERLELARHHLRTVYGDHADAWEVVLAEVGRGKETLAAAVDPELIGALRTVLEPRRIRLRAMQPFLAAAYNTARSALPSGAGWLAVAEPGRVCVAHLSADAWTALRSQRSERPLGEALPAALEQCRLAHGIEPDGGEVCLVARDQGAADLPQGSRWRVHAIALRVPAAAERRASA